MKKNIDFGLSNKEVLKNKNKYGSNEINSKRKNSFFKLLLESLGDPIIKILLIALAIKVVFLFKDTNYYESLGILIAIFFASLISSLSEYGSEKAFLKLQEESSKIKCKVKRNGNLEKIYISDIVYNDIVHLESGDMIPADGIIIKGNLTLDESTLTGESKEVKKNTINNTLFRSTVVTNGKGIMLVTAVGNNTYYGKIAKELELTSPVSPLKLRLIKLAKIISIIGYIGAFLVSFSYLFKVLVINNNFDLELIKNTLSNFSIMFSYILHALTLAVTIIVVAVPEGLPMMITLVLSSNMKRMLKKKVLVRKLTGIETAGSLNMLFTDKTGTITNGKLEMNKFILGNGKVGNKDNITNTFYELLKESLVYNLESKINNEGEIIGGNITDKAILNYFKNGVSYKYKIVKEIPFNSINKYSLVKLSNDKIYIKGAGEKILPYVKYYYDENGKKKLANIKKLTELSKIYASKSFRILVVAEKTGIYDNSLTFIAFLLLKDEIRSEVKEGIQVAKKAGIKVVMITGDTKETAYSVAKEIELINSKSDIVLTSEELNKYSDNEVKKILPNLKVVARSLPTDKSRLVKLSQELNLVVGMTGDGVNDSPALKLADVGFAMGSGTEVSKEASDIVLLDNNFLSIISAVLFGRTIFKSIRKFIIFQLTVNMCAISLSIIGPFIGVETPVTVIQMLWINMVMDTLAALAFSFEPPLKEYMLEKPKKRDENIINKYMFHEIFFTGIYSSILCILFLKLPFIKNIFENNTEDLLSAFFGLFIFITIFNSFNARTHRLNLLSHLKNNKVFIIIISLITIIQLYLIYCGGTLFRTTGLSGYELLITILLSFSVIPVDLIRKIYLRRKGIIGGV